MRNLSPHCIYNRTTCSHKADPRLGQIRADKRRLISRRHGASESHVRQMVNGQIIEGCKCSPPFGLVAYPHSNFTGDPKDQKSVMKYCLFMRGAVVSLSSKEQLTVSTSIIKAQYIALDHVQSDRISGSTLQVERPYWCNREYQSNPFQQV